MKKFYVSTWTGDGSNTVTIHASDEAEANKWADLFRLCRLPACICEVEPLEEVIEN